MGVRARAMPSSARLVVPRGKCEGTRAKQRQPLSKAPNAGEAAVGEWGLQVPRSCDNDPDDEAALMRRAYLQPLMRARTGR